MHIDIQNELKDNLNEPVIGNVYNVRGGSGARAGHVMVIVALPENGAVVLTVNKEGDIVTASRYGIHYFRDKCPIGFVEGIEEISLVMRGIS